MALIDWLHIVLSLSLPPTPHQCSNHSRNCPTFTRLGTGDCARERRPLRGRRNRALGTASSLDDGPRDERLLIQPVTVLLVEVPRIQELPPMTPNLMPSTMTTLKHFQPTPIMAITLALCQNTSSEGFASTSTDFQLTRMIPPNSKTSLHPSNVSTQVVQCSKNSVSTGTASHLTVACPTSHASTFKTKQMHQKSHAQSQPTTPTLVCATNPNGVAPAFCLTERLANLAWDQESTPLDSDDGVGQDFVAKMASPCVL